MPKKVNSICKNCGYQGYPKIKTPGLFAYEILLYFLLIIPGLAYSLWRLTHRYTMCPVCAQTNMLPMSSPIAKQIAASLNPPQPKTPPPQPPPEEFIELPDPKPDPADILQPQDEQGRYIIE